MDLTNARSRLTVAGHDLELVGVDDPHLEYDRYAAVAGPADPSAGAHGRGGARAVPRVLDAMAADGARLVIAGHTHGGQLCLPFYGALVTNCDLDRGRAKGVSRWWPGAAGAPSAQAPRDAAWLRGQRRARHVAVRAGAVRLPSRGHAADPHRALTGPSRGGRRRAGEPASRGQPTPETPACGHEVDRDAGPAWTRLGAGAVARLFSVLVALARGGRCSHGVWRSLVARFVRDEEAAGSNPVTPTMCHCRSEAASQIQGGGLFSSG